MIEAKFLILVPLFMFQYYLGYRRGLEIQKRRMRIRPPLKTQEPEKVIR